MTLLLGAVGWGLLACGALGHLVHHQRFRELLAMHLDHERLPAALFVGVESALVVALAILVVVESAAKVPVALAAVILGLGFVVWIGRLLAQNSTLPCACSFSAAPTSRWSLVRAALVLLVGLLAFDGGDLTTVETLVHLAVGLGAAAALFVLPEALSWPEASRALLQRVDAFDAANNPETA